MRALLVMAIAASAAGTARAEGDDASVPKGMVWRGMPERDGGGMARMQQSVWRWAVPEVFQSATVPAMSPPSPIFREDGTIRWRIDNLVCETDADQRLAQAFEQALEVSPRSEHVRLLPGDVLLCDNWYALHARTDFSDLNRVLYRARLV